jgi:hypothetical protein
MPILDLNALLTLRAHAPYRFGGKWFIGTIEGQMYAYRSQKSITNRAAKAGLTTFEITILGS